MNLRPAAPEDRPRLYEICLRTGADGQDATALHRDPHLLGHVYVGPYLAFARDLAFVLEDDDEVLGYVLGVADTAAFERECEERWWPELRRRYPAGTFPPGTPDAAVAGLLHTPPRTDRPVLDDYPAHLHVDLLPAAQGGGYGRRLLAHLFGALEERGAAGVHLGVSARNERALGFYRRLGFTTLQADADGALLGRRLRRAPHVHA